MNKERRQKIEDIKDRIAEMQQTAESIREDLELLQAEEQEYRDNMPESLADGERGQKADVAIEAMEEVIQDLDSFIGNDFLSPLDTAAD